PSYYDARVLLRLKIIFGSWYSDFAFCITSYLALVCFFIKHPTINGPGLTLPQGLFQDYKNGRL
ncbi:hypothetical protein, partial [Flavitalea sp.]|nr:hypothetical protein [Flavitalea sp.]